MDGVQLANVGHTYCAVEATPEADVTHRRPLEPDLERVGLEPKTVARISIAALNRHLIGSRQVVDDGQVEFRERFPDTNLTRNRWYRTGAPRGEAQLGCIIWVGCRRIFTPLGTHVELQAALGARNLNSILSEITAHVGVSDIFADGPIAAVRNVQVVERRLGHSARHPDVPGHASGIRLVDDGYAGRLAIGAGDDIERFDHGRGRKIVQIIKDGRHAAVLGGRIVFPRAPEVALDTDDAAIGLVREQLLAPATFDIATEEVGDSNRVSRHIRALGRDVPRRTNDTEFLGRDQRVAGQSDAGRSAVDKRVSRTEIAARGKLCD